MFSSRTKLSLIFGAVALVTLSCVVAVYLMGLNVTRANAACLHSMQLLLALDDTRSLFERMESGYRAYLVAGDPHHLNDYNAARSGIPERLRDLQRWAQDGELPPARVDLLTHAAETKLAELSRTISLPDTVGPEMALAALRADEDERTIDALRDQFAALRPGIQAEYDRRSRARDEANDRRTLVSAAAGLLCLGFIGWTYRRIGRALDLAEQQRRTLEESVERTRLFREAFDATANAISITDPDGTIEWVNPAFSRLTGYAAAEAVGRNPRILNSGRQPLEFYQRLWQTIRAGQAWRGELVNRRKDGTFYVEAMTITPVRDAAQHILHFIAVKEDVTERERMEQELRQTAAELRRSNQDLEQFSYVASHDLQEPLRMVTSFLQLLSERHGDKLEPDARKYIGFAVDGAQRMSHLITDLLQYARVGTQGKEPRPVALGDVVERAKANLQAAIAETSAEVAAGALPTVLGDATQLVQLFQNLIGNALKFRAPERPAGVSVGAERVNGQWRIAVADQGNGIAPENAERIFQPFKRLHGREKYPGTGIGLALCKKIAEHHGGRIWVESQPGKGSTFYITLKPA